MGFLNSENDRSTKLFEEGSFPKRSNAVALVLNCQEILLLKAQIFHKKFKWYIKQNVVK